MISEKKMRYEKTKRELISITHIIGQFISSNLSFNLDFALFILFSLFLLGLKLVGKKIFI